MSGDSTLYDSLTTSNGTGINVGSVLAVMAGIVSTAFGTEYAEFISAVWSSLVIEPLSQYVEFLRTVTGIYTLPGFFWSEAWGETAEFVEAFDVIAFPVATIVVVLLAYGVVKGWSLYG
ncbi:hypothetical protein KTS45_12510 [Halomicroarcula limicola]|uniref:Uncharacterized protein n=1 Tax=Haloarcula limicola TaxID=1429915 RepID=A0A8J8C5A5_9EURY|nr:hypothetical protein [Halomicroarcula limicola]MBV0925019.1 hypothetical protein [Halomicroarcula limicola]